MTHTPVTHTPGPWRTASMAEKLDSQFGAFAITAENGTDVADVYWYDGPNPTHEYGANARLIAAAPDLLAALEAALNTLHIYHLDQYEQAAAAIAAARGEAVEA